jgi:hypothetical protein
MHLGLQRNVVASAPQRDKNSEVWIGSRARKRFAPANPTIFMEKMSCALGYWRM